MMMNRNKVVIGIVILLVIVGGWMLFRKDPIPEAPTVEYSQSIIGAWRNVEYKGLVREFKEGGVLTDTVGKDVVVGTWQTFNSAEAPESLGGTLDPQAVYLKINLTGEERGNIYFEIASITPDTLELRYLGPGGTISFTREK